jgi:hypothetical protein
MLSKRNKTQKSKYQIIAFVKSSKPGKNSFLVGGYFWRRPSECRGHWGNLQIGNVLVSGLGGD